MEVCLPNEGDGKIQGDRGKLAREGKLNTSSIFQVIDDRRSAGTWVIQASGLCATFSTVVYAANNLFVLVPQFKIRYPTCIGHLKNFFADASKLFTFREEIIKLSVNLEARLEYERNRKNADKFYHNISSNSPPPGSSPRVPVTPSIVNWYTPPRNEVSKSVIPKINGIFLNDASDTEFESEDDWDRDHNSESDYNEDDNEDDDDFVLTKKGWYCKITKQYLNINVPTSIEIHRISNKKKPMIYDSTNLEST